VARTWLSVSVELLGGAHAEQLEPSPGRIFAVGPAHSFAQLSAAIDLAFGRWDLSHLHLFEFRDGARIGEPDEDWPEIQDEARLKVARVASVGAEFRYTFDLGDNWRHRCRVGSSKIDPLEELGVVPPSPLPYWGWGDLPDQYGRRWADDDGESDPPRPEQLDEFWL
jgi:Plasmid pRiA4b ORF-3-like protein